MKETPRQPAFGWKLLWTTLSALVATFFGVFAAFALQEYQRTDDTRKRICMVYLESRQNALVARQAKGLFEKEPKMTLRRPATLMVQAALADPNLSSELSSDQIDFLRQYANNVAVFGQVLEECAARVMSENASGATIPSELLSNVQHNIWRSEAWGSVVQEELQGYYEKYGEIDQRAEDLVAKARARKDKISRGEMNVQYPKH